MMHSGMEIRTGGAVSACIHPAGSRFDRARLFLHALCVGQKASPPPRRRRGQISVRLGGKSFAPSWPLSGAKGRPSGFDLIPSCRAAARSEPSRLTARNNADEHPNPRLAIHFLHRTIQFCRSIAIHSMPSYPWRAFERGFACHYLRHPSADRPAIHTQRQSSCTSGNTALSRPRKSSQCSRSSELSVPAWVLRRSQRSRLPFRRCDVVVGLGACSRDRGHGPCGSRTSESQIEAFALLATRARVAPEASAIDPCSDRDYANERF